MQCSSLSQFFAVLTSYHLSQHDDGNNDMLLFSRCRDLIAFHSIKTCEFMCLPLTDSSQFCSEHFPHFVASSSCEMWVTLSLWHLAYLSCSSMPASLMFSGVRPVPSSHVPTLSTCRKYSHNIACSCFPRSQQLANCHFPSRLLVCCLLESWGLQIFQALNTDSFL